ncbi:hypothetical protein JX265_011470 [Neoarthrinium moseri]|uniref:CBM1 domain-containing protein n=1 Tax=Neoarthrinium moseri TaxID=1658444 RepID=A0A9P9WCE4_9PEZI|nr:hypothetical protein JX265_011470 [Neoarthrinium moseri]
MKYAIVFAAVAPLVAGHGALTSPTPRKAGSALASVCGEQIFNNMNSDSYGNIQGETQLIQSDFTAECNLWLCKGFQFEDNKDNVQSYTAGQVVPMTFELRAPHTGFANVSIVDTATNAVIGDALASWDVFASNSQATSANESSYSVTIPDLGGKCATAGECVIQHFWHSESAGQTYESCVDFTVGGSSSGGSGSSSTVVAAPSTTAAATSAAASTTQATAISSAPAATTTAATPTGTDDEDDDSCEAEETSTAPSAEATGEAGDDEDDSCDAEETEPVTSAVPTTAVPTTLITRTSSKPASATPTSGSSTGSVALYGQCGGKGFTGSTTCASGTCTVMNEYYSQCV